MKFISNIIKRFAKDEKKILGRWNIDYCDKKMNNKVDMSNEHHCGPCGQYILNKEQPVNPNKNSGLGKTNDKI
jgi:hypothetical protein